MAVLLGTRSDDDESSSSQASTSRTTPETSPELASLPLQFPVVVQDAVLLAQQTDGANMLITSKNAGLRASPQQARSTTQTAQQPLQKTPTILRRFTNKLRVTKGPTSPSSPASAKEISSSRPPKASNKAPLPSDLAALERRQNALRARGLLPARDLSALERELDDRLDREQNQRGRTSESAPRPSGDHGSSEAAKIKAEWEASRAKDSPTPGLTPPSTQKLSPAPSPSRSRSRSPGPHGDKLAAFRFGGNTPLETEFPRTTPVAAAAEETASITESDSSDAQYARELHAFLELDQVPTTDSIPEPKQLKPTAGPLPHSPDATPTATPNATQLVFTASVLKDTGILNSPMSPSSFYTARGGDETPEAVTPTNETHMETPSSELDASPDIQPVVLMDRPPLPRKMSGPPPMRSLPPSPHASPKQEAAAPAVADAALEAVVFTPSMGVSAMDGSSTAVAEGPELDADDHAGVFSAPVLIHTTPPSTPPSRAASTHTLETDELLPAPEIVIAAEEKKAVDPANAIQEAADAHMAKELAKWQQSGVGRTSETIEEESEDGTSDPIAASIPVPDATYATPILLQPAPASNAKSSFGRRASISFSSLRRNLTKSKSSKQPTRGALAAPSTFDSSHLPPSPTLSNFSTGRSLTSVGSASGGSSSSQVSASRTGVNPKMHDQEMMQAQTSNIEDADSRRLTEMAFLM